MKNYNKAKKIADDIFNIMRDNQVSDEELLIWSKSNHSATEVIDNFSNPEKLSDALKHFVKEEKYLKSKELLRKLRRRTRILIIKRVSAVAAILIAISFLVWNTATKTDIVLDETTMETEVKNKNIIKPTLILASGKEISIDNSQTVKVSELIENAVTEEVEYNTLIVPQKYTIKIDLADGTIVHINANSELRYPSKFTGDKREVFLDGEAFFEVSKSNIPFIVNSNGTEIKVYGTKFNVNSYTEASVKTLLIEGSVGVTIGGKETILKPNQLSVVDINKNEDTILNVSPEKYIAWTDGYFRYDNDPLEYFIEELGRWHNVKFIFKNEKDKDLLITSSFRRDLTLQEIVNTTSKTLNLKFKLEKGVYIIE